MQIIRTKYFIKIFQNTLLYIAKDKYSASVKFKNDLNKQIDNLKNFPYKYRPSKYYEEQSIRDMTFKGYSIIYRVKEDEKVIEILEIFNKNLPLKQNS